MVLPVLIGAFAPAIFAAILLLAAGALKSDDRLWWATPIAVAAGFVIAQLATDGAPTFPPTEVAGWFTPIAMALGALALAIANKPSGLARLAVRVVVVLAIVLRIVWPLLGPTWSPGVAAGWIIGMTLVAVVTWTSLEGTARTATGWGLPAALLVNAAGVAVVLVSSGSARYAQLAGSMASVMGPIAVLGFLRKASPLLLSAGWVVTTLLAMLLVAGVTFVDVPLVPAALVALAPVAFRIADLKALQSRPAWQREAVRIGVTVVLVAIAAFLSMPEPESYEY